MSNELKPTATPAQVISEIIADDTIAQCITSYLKMECSNLTATELTQFCLICKLHNLNPLKKEVYAIKYNGKFQIVVNYYEYLKIAEKSGQLEFFNVDVIYNDDKTIDKAVFTGKRKDRSKEIKMEFPFKEWNQQQALWRSKPHFMIEKVALANGLRRLFPLDIAPLPYTKEEDYITVDINEPRELLDITKLNEALGTEDVKVKNS